MNHRDHHGAVKPRVEEDLIDLRDEVLVRSGPGSGVPESSGQKSPSSELLIDFSE